MSEMTLIVPNDWVTEEKLVEITGLRPGTIERARKKCWMVGREYLHVSPDGVPKKNSECMYNRKAVDQWVESMSENNAKFDYDGTTIGWSSEFSAWYDERREQYLKEARDYLDEEATNEEIDEEIENELEAWND